MNVESERISLEHFSTNLASILESVIREHRTIEVETPNGGVAVVTPGDVETSHLSTETAKDFEAFRAAAGSWSDVDIDTLLEHIYESRRGSSRPAVEL